MTSVPATPPSAMTNRTGLAASMLNIVIFAPVAVLDAGGQHNLNCRNPCVVMD
ncbi:hypothetical protein [Dactylosporangium sp. CA-233914]|uniref:hypothetical protein n=1 Tax=Dactylosporangium sp. CA-233914 TaxID=3239934 RepID=UPI003D8FD9B3